MDTKTLLESLKAAGFSDHEIARKLNERGVSVSQPTITRIRSGRHADPRASIASGVRGLYDALNAPEAAA